MNIKIKKKIFINRFKLPCLIIAGINEEGKTILFSLALIASETLEYFKWAFDRFRFFSKINDENVTPLLVITDEDEKMIGAITEIFPNAIHQICSWHKSQNFKKHFLSITKCKDNRES